MVDIEPHPKSEEAHQSALETTLAFSALGIALSAPCTLGVAIATLEMSLALSDIRSGTPHELAATQWEKFASGVSDEHERVIGLRDRILEDGSELWSGPGSEKFLDYVDDTLKPAFTELEESANKVAKILRSNSKDLLEGMDELLLGFIIALAELVVSKALLFVPKVGVALHEVAVVFSNLKLFDATIREVADQVIELGDDWSESNDLQQLIVEIARNTASEEESLGDKANGLKDQLPAAVGEHGEWEPA